MMMMIIIIIIIISFFVLRIKNIKRNKIKMKTI